MLWGFAAYIMWGFFPAFFPLLEPAAPVEILAHRFIWTLVFVVLLLLAFRRINLLREISLREWGGVTVASLLISLNWGLYIYAVNSGHVADAALGYFINPLVSVVLGVLLLGEYLRPMQKLSVAVAFVAVVILTIALGQPPIISLGLALSFGFYGLVKKRMTLQPLQSLAAETMVLAPVALIYLLWLGPDSTFTTEGTGHMLLLMTAGVVTALPLLAFARAAQEMSLTSLGMIQYLTPVMQMLWAVFVTKEHIEPMRWVGFGIIWVAVIIFIVDMVIQTRGAKRKPNLERIDVADAPGAAE